MELFFVVNVAASGQISMNASNPNASSTSYIPNTASAETRKAIGVQLESLVPATWQEPDITKIASNQKLALILVHETVVASMEIDGNDLQGAARSCALQISKPLIFESNVKGKSVLGYARELALAFCRQQGVAPFEKMAGFAG